MWVRSVVYIRLTWQVLKCFSSQGRSPAASKSRNALFPPIILIYSFIAVNHQLLKEKLVKNWECLIQQFDQLLNGNAYEGNAKEIHII